MSINFRDESPSRRFGTGRGTNPGPEDEDGNPTAIFYCGLGALVAGVFTAVAYFSGGISGWPFTNSEPPAFVSKVDPICQRIWKSPGRNDDALACYMVESPHRFCDPQERQHLVSMIKRYRADIAVFQAKILKEVASGEVFSEINAHIERQEKGLPQPKLKPRPKNKYLKNKSLEANLADFQKKVFDPSSRGKNSELSMLLRGVLAQGYFDQSEFGWFQDELVTEALSPPIPEVKSPCKPANS
jgi:hypothetical protein